MIDYDVLVVGGGHAGCEAAAAASRTGARVGLVSMSVDSIGAMSCNPSIGGVGKGHLVREVDALDGLMARAADAAAIHHRMLNRSKGAAVHGPRMQADRSLYARAIRTLLDKARVTLIEDEAAALHLRGHVVDGLELSSGSRILARAVVLATGTFLGGRLFRGTERYEGGRAREAASTRLAAQLRELALPMGRLKTGTPPRLDGRTIAWDRLQRQPSDTEAWTMSPMTRSERLPQIACALSRTNEATHDLIRSGMSDSPVIDGAIVGSGPRYCPSIEDKVVRFADRSSHQIFLEPEGLDTHLVYPNGISTSLSAEAQCAFVRTIEGLERAEIISLGYAVEYDFIDPRTLDRGLGLSAYEGVFMAGQINGTTGYEEAAAQGLVAGLSAGAHALGERLPMLEREDSYIAVMIDDLTLQGVSEPYRMLTARAEHRLRLRADNAETRLKDFGFAVGCLTPERRSRQDARVAERARIEPLLEDAVDAETLVGLGLVEADGLSRRSLTEWTQTLSSTAGLERLLPVDLQGPVALEVLQDGRYKPYVARQYQELARIRKDRDIFLPIDLAFDEIAGLSIEMIERLSKAKPRSLAEAGRIRGVTPAALSAILVARNKLAA